jgi:hypothetical protein
VSQTRSLFIADGPHSPILARMLKCLAMPNEFPAEIFKIFANHFRKRRVGFLAVAPLQRHPTRGQRRRRDAQQHPRLLDRLADRHSEGR